MQTSLHIYALVAELNETINGAIFTATEFYKKEREAYIIFKTKKGAYALGLAYHPIGYGSFLIPRGKIDVKTNEKPWPFFQIALSGEVQSVSQIGLDRLIRIDINKDDHRFAIISEAIGPNGNYWLVDSNDKIIATLRKKAYDPDSKYNPPSLIDRLNPFDSTPDDLIQLFRNTDTRLEDTLRKKINGFDVYLAREIIARAGLEPDQISNDLLGGEYDNLVETIGQVAGFFKNHQKGYTYNDPIIAMPFKLHSLPGDYHKSKTLSLATYRALKTKQTVKAEISEKQGIMDALGRFIKRLKKKKTQIENDICNADKHDLHRKYAELLKANLINIKKGVKIVELDDLYSETIETVKIKLDPALSPVANADSYFKKYHKGKEGLSLLKRRLEVADKELISTEVMLDEFLGDFDSACQKYRAEVAAIVPSTTAKRATVARLPYRTASLVSGVTVFIGKDGTDNDETTFHHAKPYELWFHASQCPGSHVVMKFPDKNFKPSKSEIIETASMAAYYSKARKSKTVPVIYTQRKYVRKPRRAKPGLVTVEREKLVMVVPKKPR